MDAAIIEMRADIKELQNKIKNLEDINEKLDKIEDIVNHLDVNMDRCKVK